MKYLTTIYVLRKPRHKNQSEVVIQSINATIEGADGGFCGYCEAISG